MIDTPATRSVLYMTYDGMTDPLGASQILPYLTALARRGHRIALVSFEKPDCSKDTLAAVREVCAEAGIDWHPQRYHKKPPIISAIRDVWVMLAVATRLHKRTPFDIAHCRSYIPALVGLSLKRRFGIRFLFDMRGFWADERAEGGFFPTSNPLFRAVYRYFKRKETDFFREADHIVSLTHSAREEIERWPGAAVAPERISVIPCCVDFDHFAAPSIEHRRQGRAVLGIANDRPVLGYLGSIGGLYMLPEMLRLFLAYRKRRPGALFLFVTRGSPQSIITEAAAHGITGDELMIRSASRDEVPLFIGAADLGVSFIRPSFSKKASSPTKLGEMLALGIPVITNKGVGDVAEIVDNGAGAVAVNGFDDDALAAAVDEILAQPASPDTIRASARERFDLEDGIEAYDVIYRSLNAAARG